MDINIKITERSYGGKKFRPQSIVHFDKSNNLLICVTPWGQAAIAEKVSDSIKNFITMASEDSELTVPYARKENLQQMGNTLRMAVIMASEKIFNEFNQEEYNSAFEIFAAIQDGPQWIWVSCGQPSLVVMRQGLGIIPLYQSIDLNVLTQKHSIQDPLPNHLLGLGQHPPIQFGNLRLNSQDKMALISRTYLPNSLFAIDQQFFASEDIAKLLADDSPNIPFWLGFIEIN